VVRCEIGPSEANYIPRYVPQSKISIEVWGGESRLIESQRLIVGLVI
jgi:hypothetical protein